MKTLKLTHYNDPAHGWLRVPNKLLAEMGIAYEISAYSYMTEKYSYLEEDMDWATFSKAAEAMGYKLEISDSYTNGQSPIRNYPTYKAEYVVNPIDVSIGSLIRVHTGQLLEVTARKGQWLYFTDTNTGQRLRAKKNQILDMLW